MRININRLSKLAGLPTSNQSKRSLYEGKKHKEEEQDEGMRDEGMRDEGMRDEGMRDEGMYEMDDMHEDEMDEGMYEEDDGHGEADEGMYEDDMEEMIDVDEKMLVQELRRAKRIMQENKKRARLNESRRQRREQRIFEAQLRRLIDEEVQNVFDEMNYSNGWVYGKEKPRRSKTGYTHQGSFLPGIGFKR